MAEKFDYLAIFGPADQQDEEAIKSYSEHLSEKQRQQEEENDFELDLEDIPDDEVDEEELEAFLNAKEEKRKEEKNRKRPWLKGEPAAFNDDLAGRPSWKNRSMFVNNAKGNPIKFAPLAICDWLYQARALSVWEKELYFLADDFDDPMCDGLYRHGDDMLASELRETCWPNAPESSIREVILTAHRYMMAHPRRFEPNAQAFVCRNAVDDKQFTVLMVDPESGEIDIHDGYVDPALQVTSAYDLGVVWRDFSGELTDEEREAVELVDHLVDGVTGDDPRLALRLLEAAACAISVNKREAGIPVNMSYDAPGKKNGSNGKSTFWHVVQKVFSSVMVEASLSCMRDNTGLSRLVGKLAWYVDESTPAISEQDATTLKALSLGATEAVNVKFEKYASNVFGTFILSSNFHINFGAKFNGEATQRRVHILPFLADVKNGPHAIPGIKDKIFANKIAHSYILWLLIQARRVFVRSGYVYEAVPAEYGDLDREMFDATSPLELWLREVGEDVITGYRPEWRVPHLVETSDAGKTKRWLVFPLHMASQAKEYRRRVLEQKPGAALPYVVDASGAEERGRIMPDTRAVFANDKMFLFSQFASWCNENGIKAPGSTTWARLLSQRRGKIVRCVDHVYTPIGTRTLLFEPAADNIENTLSFREAVERAEAVRDGRARDDDEPAVLTTNDFNKIQKIALAVRDFGGFETDGDSINIKPWAASSLAWSVLEAYGLIPRDSKLTLAEAARVEECADPEREKFIEALMAM